MAHALGRHLALVGFMGAGKSTLGEQAAERLGRRFVDLDRELERSLRQTIPQIFGARGEADFRELEAEAALGRARQRAARRGRARRRRGRDRADPAARFASTRFTVHVEIDPATAWTRVGGGDRPLAQDEQSFHALHEQRSPLYDEVAQAVANNVDEIVLAAAGIEVDERLLARLPELVDGRGGSGRRRDRARAPPAAARGAGPRPARRRGGQEPRRGRAALARAAARPRRHDRRLRRRLHDRHGGLRGGDVPARRAVGRRPDDAGRPGRRGDRRQDGGQPARGQEPRRRLPLARANGDRPGAPRDAAARRAAAREWRKS